MTSLINKIVSNLLSITWPDNKPRGIDIDPVKKALIETFVAFSEKIGCKIIAEGIETKEELSVLMDLGVHYGQGYLLAKPCYPKPEP